MNILIFTNENENCSKEFNMLNHDNELAMLDRTLHEFHNNNIDFIDYYTTYTTIMLLFWVHVVVLFTWFCFYIYDTRQEYRYANRYRLR